MNFKITGKTKDTNDDVFQVSKDKSYMEGCIHDKGMNIWAVMTTEKGDFKEMMDFLVDKTWKNHITFTMVINDNLKNTLKGFKHRKIYWNKLGVEMDVLEGEWKNVKL